MLYRNIQSELCVAARSSHRRGGTPGPTGTRLKDGEVRDPGTSGDEMTFFRWVRHPDDAAGFDPVRSIGAGEAPVGLREAVVAKAPGVGKANRTRPPLRQAPRPRRLALEEPADEQHRHPLATTGLANQRPMPAVVDEGTRPDRARRLSLVPLIPVGLHPDQRNGEVRKWAKRFSDELYGARSASA